MRAIDLTEQQFGTLKVLKRDTERKNKDRQACWICECLNCGSIKSYRASSLKKHKSCGCLNSKFINYHTEKRKQASKENAEKRRIDLIGQRFSRLVVLEYADEEHQKYYNGSHRVTWKCRCDCGNICYVTTEMLKNGDTPSCGCITKENQRAKLKDLSGQRFGSLSVIKWIGTINGNSRYLVKCDCGKEYEVYANNLTEGCTVSCGCEKLSHGELKIMKILKEYNIRFEMQKVFSDFRFSDTGGIPKYDFYLIDYNILIEFDGEQHFRPVYNWETKEQFNLRKKHDIEKNEYAINNNIVLIRIPYTHYDDLSIDDLLLDSKFIINKGEKIA